MGAGRSGTTVLDILLGNANDIFSCGELTRFPQLKGIPHNYPENSKTYQFWSYFRTSLEDKLGGAIDYQALFKQYEKFDHHKGFIRNYFDLHPLTDLRNYKAFLNVFFETLFEMSGKDVLIDSSKYANRAITLSKLLPYKLCFINVIRNPVGVINSFKKKNVEQPSRNWVSSNKYYFTVNSICSLVGKRLQKNYPFIAVKYENLVTDPVSTLKKIQNNFDVDLTCSIELIQKQQPLKVGYLFDGNRLRLEKEIRLNNHGVMSATNYTLKDRVSTAINYLWRR